MSAPDGRQLDAWCDVLGLRLVEVSRPVVLAALVGLLRHMGYGVIPSQSLTRMHRDLTLAWEAEHGSTVRELLLASATGALAAHVSLTPSREDFGDVMPIPRVRLGPDSTFGLDADGHPRLESGGGYHQGDDGTAHPLEACGPECTPP